MTYMTQTMTEPADWSVGEYLTAAKHDAEIRDNMKAQSAYLAAAAGDMFYASAAKTLAKLVKGVAGQILSIGASAPAWVTLERQSGIFEDGTPRSATGNGAWNDVPALTLTLTLVGVATIMAVVACHRRRDAGAATDSGFLRIMIDGVAMTSMAPTTDTGTDRPYESLVGRQAGCAAGARVIKLQHFGAAAANSVIVGYCNILAWTVPEF